MLIQNYTANEYTCLIKRTMHSSANRSETLYSRRTSKTHNFTIPLTVYDTREGESNREHEGAEPSLFDFRREETYFHPPPLIPAFA